MKGVITKTLLGLWSGLGFYRGYESYENKSNKNKIKAIGYGFCGLFIYINPIAIPLIINSEYKKWRDIKN